MPVKQLHPEIWAKIIGHLQRPLPPPTGDNDRADLQQGDLSTVMRVSKVSYGLCIARLTKQLFNNLAAP